MTERATKVIPEKAIGYKSTGEVFELSEKDALLYAVGIGFSLDPLREEDYKYTNELHESFSVFPTMSSTMKTTGGFELVISCPYIPSFPLHNLLHGEEKLFMIKPEITLFTKYQQESEIIDIQDKGKNGVIYVRQTCYEIGENGQREKVYYIDRSFFVRGLGGFGFKGTNVSPPIPNAPQKSHQIEFVEKTFPNQCFIYRLCEDSNPLHIDPGMASMGGFEKPIIHGLATYGTVIRGLSKHLLGNDHTLIQSVGVKFVGHVFPGETLSVKVWKNGNKRYFQAETVERQKKVVVGELTIREGAKL